MSGEDALDAFYAALLDGDAEQLYDRAPCGYLSTAPDGLIVKVNQTFLTLTGYSRDELVGQRTFAELLSAGGRIYHETHYAPMLRMTGSAHEIALDIVRTDRTRLPVLVNSVLERDADGAPRVVRTAVFDATQRRSYERELVRAKQRAEESEARAKALAQTLQRTLIPPAVPVIRGLDVAAAYRPAGDGAEVGGDFYDVFQISTDEWVVAIGDVCGKGVAAAVVTALARYTLRAASVREPLPSQALGVLNDVLLQDESDRFATVGLLRLRRRPDGTWVGLYASAGHPLPRQVGADGVPTPFGRAGDLAGVLTEPSFWDAPVTLEPGDALVLYTDGVTEGRRGDEQYGEDRLDARLSAAATGAGAQLASRLTDGLLADLLAFQSGHARDDIAVVTVAVPPGG